MSSLKPGERPCTIAGCVHATHGGDVLRSGVAAGAGWDDCELGRPGGASDVQRVLKMQQVGYEASNNTSSEAAGMLTPSPTTTLLRTWTIIITTLRLPPLLPGL